MIQKEVFFDGKKLYSNSYMSFSDKSKSKSSWLTSMLDCDQNL